MRLETPTHLEIDHALWQTMVAHVEAARPHEGCGLIAMRGNRAVRIFPGTNTEFSPSRYNMDPREVAAALHEMRQMGCELGAIFHSHPASSPVPSETDLRLAYWPEALMVIISLAGAEPDVRAYRYETDSATYRSVAIRIRPGPGEAGRPMAQRKVIGVLGGMGPLATADLYRKIIEATPAERDQDHLHVVIEANPAVPDRTDALLGDGPDPTPLLIAGAQRLEHAGADFIVMPCNTAHAFLPRVTPSIAIPVVSMIDETARSVARQVAPGSSVGILATAGTIAAGLYQAALDAAGLVPLTPSAEAQREVTAAIGAVKRGQIGREATERVLVAARELIERGAQALLAACTELPLILRQSDVDVLLVDPTQVLALAAVRRSLESEPSEIVASMSTSAATPTHTHTHSEEDHGDADRA